MERKLLIKGKVKEAYDLGDRLEFKFTDNISVFDKVIPSLIPFKGETLCREGVYWFERAAKMGIKTHFLEFIPPGSMLCKKVDILQPHQITSRSKNFLIPLEFICRWYVAGSLFDRVREGKIPAGALGFASGHKITYGEPLPEPFLEVSTKLEKTDRLLNKADALKISGLAPQEYEEAREIVLQIDEDINRSVAPRGLIHVDGKKELAFDEDRRIMVVDVYGTADEDRFWDKARYDAGEFVDLSKEYVRQYYRQTGYKDLLYAARDAGSAEPPIPALPPEVVNETCRIYIKLFEMITGEKFVPARSK
ncbi:MAG: Phosphoribosylaminoimidazole-succinocarboxamide synthase [Methanosaeta sp. PtaB.Bin018]|jgi:phosphoribosylaminoimidazole-succinocarboxamide synthase|nr:phosphoribosylaminoimidazolesuccinocarboxamide synthase [Methanothrix sp.]OPX76745.1 MAG: Phosphoribosylaminoimidazole-succinocarboxamide synthase [Methanosaeta sp. PtaB.Bin018]HOV51771.1 phosphoribosylaminoimidazolesuccinocarboxamide synthase [Methanothrix sp.]